MKKILIVLCVCILLFGVIAIFNFDNNDSGNNNSNDVEITTDYSKLTYTAFGDSITKGVPYHATPYVDVVADILGLKSYNNLGIGSSSISNISGRPAPFCTRFNDIPNDSDIISIFGGANDIFTGELGDINSNDTTTICGALNFIIDKVKEKCPNAFIFLITQYEFYIDDNITCNVSLEDLSNVMKQITKNKGIKCLDFYSMYKLGELSFVDDIHPTQSTINRRIAPAIAQFIKDNIEK